MEDHSWEMLKGEQTLNSPSCTDKFCASYSTLGTWCIKDNIFKFIKWLQHTHLYGLKCNQHSKVMINKAPDLCNQISFFLSKKFYFHTKTQILWYKKHFIYLNKIFFLQKKYYYHNNTQNVWLWYTNNRIFFFFNQAFFLLLNKCSFHKKWNLKRNLWCLGEKSVMMINVPQTS